MPDLSWYIPHRGRTITDPLAIGHPLEVSPLSRGTIVSAPIRLNRHVSDVVAALADCISFAVGAAETSHPAAGEEMYEAGATETVKAPAPAPNRRPDEGSGPTSA